VIGALCFSVLLSLVATPTIYFLLTKLIRRPPIQSATENERFGT
jgi:hypothetical protein